MRTQTISESNINRVRTMKRRIRTEKKKTAALLLAFMLAVLGAAGLPLLDGNTYAAPDPATGQEESVTLSNEAGEELTINVEDEIPGEERAAQEAQGLTGTVDLEDSGVPLAGFVPSSMDSDSGGDIHIGWMLALLALVLIYVGYFTAYQKRIFSLRREIAAAERRHREGGRK